MTKRRRALLFLGVLLIALNLRPAVTSVPPVLEAIRTDLGLSYTAVSLLTTIPTLGIGVFAFAAAPASRWLGRERALLWTVVLIGVATAMRIAGTNVAVLFGSTILVGVGISIGQSLLPSVVNDHFPDRTALVTGLYTSSHSIGAAVAAGGTTLLVGALGSWPISLAFWAILALVAVVVWIPIARGANAETVDEPTSQGGLPWRNAGAWILTLFYGFHSVLYYSILTWIAPIYIDLGWNTEQAGFLLTLFVIAQLGGTLGIAVPADRTIDRRPWLALTVVMTGLGLAGIVWLPFASPWGWAILTGGGMGAMFALGMTLPADLAPDPSAADRLSAMMIGVGYIIGAAGPLAVGGVRDFAGSYDPSFIALIVVSGGMLLSVIWFRPDRSIP